MIGGVDPFNDVERRNSPNSTYFQADYITVVEDRPMMSVKYCLPVKKQGSYRSGKTGKGQGI